MPPEMMVSSSLRTLSWSHLLSYTRFGWLLHVKYYNMAIKGQDIFYLCIFFVAQFAALHEESTPPHTLSPSRAPSPSSLPSFPPTSGWLLLFWPNSSHLRPMPSPISLFLYVLCFVTPNKGTSHCERKPSAGHLQLTHREQRRNDLGAPLTYPWWERAKPLEGWVAAAHVGCCVLRCVVCCDLSRFSYHPGSKTISAKSKWPIFARSYHKKQPPNTPNITGCVNSSSFRDVAHVLTFWCKAVWAMQWACKSGLKFS